MSITDINKKIIDSIEKNKPKLEEYYLNVAKMKTLGFDYVQVFGDATAMYNNFVENFQQNQFQNINDFILNMGNFMNDIKDHYKKSFSGNSNELYKLGVDTSDLEQKDIDFLLDFFCDCLNIDEDTISWWIFDDDKSFDGKDIKVFYTDANTDKEKTYNVLDAKNLLAFYYK